MSKQISTQDYIDLGREFGLSVRLIKTVVLVESSGKGFAPNGDILIQFEPHIFKKYTGVTIENKVDVQSKEWSAYKEAKNVNWGAALLSTSWGLGQIMGFNFKAAGYDSVSAMVSEFGISEYYQLKGMLNFIKFNPTMFKALKEMDWATFARLYNGPKYEQMGYHTKMKNTYERLG